MLHPSGDITTFEAPSAGFIASMRRTTLRVSSTATCEGGGCFSVKSRRLKRIKVTELKDDY